MPTDLDSSLKTMPAHILGKFIRDLPKEVQDGLTNDLLEELYHGWPNNRHEAKFMTVITAVCDLIRRQDTQRRGGGAFAQPQGPAPIQIPYM